MQSFTFAWPAKKRHLPPGSTTWIRLEFLGAHFIDVGNILGQCVDHAETSRQPHCKLVAHSLVAKENTRQSLL